MTNQTSLSSSAASHQMQLKQMVAQKAVNLLKDQLDDQAVLGIGSGSTVFCVIDELIAAVTAGELSLRGCVVASEASRLRLEAGGISVLSTQKVPLLSWYVDGADEINPDGFMIKGGGGALTREKILAASSANFLCVADQSKWKTTLGEYPLPIEIVPMAMAYVKMALGWLLKVKSEQCVLRQLPNGQNYITDNGNWIIDVHGLIIDDPLTIETQIEQIVGVVMCGVFAHNHASMCLLAKDSGVETIQF